MADAKQLKQKRAVLKGSQTKFRNFLGVFEAQGKSIIELQERLERIQKELDEFYEIQLNIEFLCKENELEAENVEREAYENTHFELVARAKQIILEDQARRAEAQRTNHDASFSSNMSLQNQFNQQISRRLPVLDLPKFSGDYLEWSSFFDTFKAMVHNDPAIEKITKFYYLLSCMKSDAAKVLQNLEVTNDNYDVALDLLRARYENPMVLTKSHVQALFNLPCVTKENSTLLRKLSDDFHKHLRALKSLGENVDGWDTLLIHLVSIKLDDNSRKEWEKIAITKGKPKTSDMTEYLSNRCQILETIQYNQNQENVNKNKSQFKQADKRHGAVYSHVSTQNVVCKLCHENNHYIQSCPKFLELDCKARLGVLQSLKLCFNCLRGKHFVQFCRSKSNCGICTKRHNSLVHPPDASFSVTKNQSAEIKHNINSQSNTSNIQREHFNLPGQSHSVVENSQAPISFNSMHASQSHCNKETHVLLATAEIIINDSHGNAHKARCVVDSGSQTQFLSRTLFKALKLDCEDINIPVIGVGQAKTNITQRTVARISSANGYSPFTAELSFLIIDRITDKVPNFKFDPSILNIPKNIVLADQHFYKQNEVDVLLGAGIFYDLLLPGKIELGRGMPIIQNSLLGWLIAGPINITKGNKNLYTGVHCNFTQSVSNIELHKQIERFWSVEEIKQKRELSKEEAECENHFVENTTTDEHGRFVVSLPFREDSIPLGDSLECAKKRFYNLERRLNQNTELKKQYVNFMTEYDRLGHMTKISSQELQTQELSANEKYYLPHHCVVNESSTSTKYRVVFDGSQKTSTGVSLNENLKIGPTIQDDLFAILIRFREHKYVIGADIQKMYRQINIKEKQRNFQRIVWRTSPDEILEHYRLNTVTYGTSPASFLAIRSLHEIAYRNMDKFPSICKIILKDFFVDDLLTGEQTIEGAKEIKTIITNLLATHGFKLHKWVSNHKGILDEMQDCDVGSGKGLTDKDETRKTLGLIWIPESDVLTYALNLEKSLEKDLTKRVVLRRTAQLFDPLGLIGPVIVRAKIFMQTLWQLGLNWDDKLPDELIESWTQFYSELSVLNQIKIPRLVTVHDTKNITQTEIHGFCDSSEKAYGATLYLRTKDKCGNVTVRLLCAKSRVAPLKSISLPRLELCGALLLSQLFDTVKKATNIKFDRCFMWTDSTVVLSWLSAEPCKWKVFVSNRVSEIQSLTKECIWKHVPTYDNPSDKISRGTDPKQLLTCDLWWLGPQWLKLEAEYWPNDFSRPRLDSELPEIRQNTVVLLNFETKFHLFCKYSSLHKLIRITALLLRFKSNLTVNKNNKTLGKITTDEFNHSLLRLVKLAQREMFFDELKCFSENKPLSNNSKLRMLNPFLAEDGLIRVGGRIQRANIEYERKFPIVISKNHPFTKLIIMSEHLKHLHAGPQTILYNVRQKYWPLSGRQAVRSVLRKCVACFRANPTDIVRIMGNLPEKRVNENRPFFATGVDFAGPFNIKDGKFRNRKIIKAYMCIFVCFATKAVHIEIVSDLSTEAFLNCFKRFVSRRGLCGYIYSDNGRNFIGARNELQGFFENLQNDSSLSQFCQVNNIEWMLIPPRSPHHGGIWEAAVKAAKYHLHRIVSTINLTFEDLSTVFAQVEAILNSRPLTPMSNDPRDLLALTPGHFLIGSSLIAMPQGDVTKIPTNRLNQYQFLQSLIQHFWKRWSHEYLCNLQKRSKWHASSSQEIKEGSLVLLKDENTAPQVWRMGRVLQLYPGNDGVTRVVSVRTVSGIVKRSVQKLCVLPVDI